MKVKDIMQSGVSPIEENFTVVQAATFLIEKRLLGTPVINTDGEMVGFLSEKDLFRSLFPTYSHYHKNPAEYVLEAGIGDKVEGVEHKKVKDIMSEKVVYATPDEAILDVGNKMLKNNIHKIPVVENKKPVSMVSRIDIYRAILKEYFKLDVEIHTP